MKPWQLKMQYLRTAMREKGWNYTNLGNHLGVSRQGARRMMAGDHCPSLENYLILKNAILGNSISEGVNSENKNDPGNTSERNSEKTLNCLNTLKAMMVMMGKTNEPRYHECLELIDELNN